MPELSWEATKLYVHERAQGCCEYCRTCEANIGQTMHVEHMDPHGNDDPENLCLACPNCNFSKAVTVTAIDTLTGELVSLYNPRHQQWSEHFIWIEEYTQIQGRSATGRATVERLKMNRPRMVLARQRWVQAGFHPPQD